MFAMLNFMGFNCEKIIKIMELDFNQVYNIVEENGFLITFWLFCIFICLYYFKSYIIIELI